MKTKIKSFFSLCFAFFGLSLAAQSGYGEIRGYVYDTELEPVQFATVKILQGNQLIGGTQTNAEGKYSYKPLTPGKYEILIMESGHLTQPVNKISVSPDDVAYVDVKMQINTLGTITIVAPSIDYTKSGVDRSLFVMKTLDATEIFQNASFERGNMKGLVEAISSEVVKSSDGDIHVRGGRGDATAYFVDGVRTIGATNVPGLAIENLTFFSGGVPAMYGDMTSGAVIVTTKSYFSGIRDKDMRIRAQWEKEEHDRLEERERQLEEKRKKEIEQEKKEK